jgi:hypothetical protein
VPDHDDGLGDAVKRVDRGSDAVLETRLGIVQGKVGRDRAVTTLLQERHQCLPAGPIVPIAVDQTEGGHGGCLPRPAADTPPARSPR